jgi:hypothetical protein
MTGKLDRNLYSLGIQKSFDSVFGSGLRLNNTLSQPHEHAQFFVESIGNVNSLERFVLKFTGKFAGIDRIAFIYFFFIGGRHICGVDNDESM